MKNLVKIIGFIILIIGCKPSKEEMQLEEFLQTHYPATKVKILSIGKLDSIYDPFNAVSDMLRNGIYRSEEKPDFGTVLDDNKNPKNAIGRIAKVKYHSNHLNRISKLSMIRMVIFCTPRFRRT